MTSFNKTHDEHTPCITDNPKTSPPESLESKHT